jgi:hypothetical protein
MQVFAALAQRQCARHPRLPQCQQILQPQREHPHDPIATGRGQWRTVVLRAKGHARHLPDAARQAIQLLAGSHVPNLDRVVAAAVGRCRCRRACLSDRR